MNRNPISDGVEVLHAGQAKDRLVVCYPDGRRIETTWSRLAMINELIASLREAYELLLDRASREAGCNPLPLEPLIRMDEVLYALLPVRVDNFECLPPAALVAPAARDRPAVV
jgi:hypothetical protein